MLFCQKRHPFSHKSHRVHFEISFLCFSQGNGIEKLQGGRGCCGNTKFVTLCKRLPACEFFFGKNLNSSWKWFKSLDFYAKCWMSMQPQRTLDVCELKQWAMAQKILGRKILGVKCNHKDCCYCNVQLGLIFLAWLDVLQMLDMPYQKYEICIFF